MSVWLCPSQQSLTAPTLFLSNWEDDMTGQKSAAPAPQEESTVVGPSSGLSLTATTAETHPRGEPLFPHLDTEDTPLIWFRCSVWSLTAWMSVNEIKRSLPLMGVSGSAREVPRKPSSNTRQMTPHLPSSLGTWEATLIKENSTLGGQPELARP